MGSIGGIFVCLVKVGGISRRNSFTISIIALFVVLPYVKFEICCAGDRRMCIMLDATCWRHVSGVTVVNGTCWEKKSILSASRVLPVEGM